MTSPVTYDIQTKVGELLDINRKVLRVVEGIARADNKSVAQGSPPPVSEDRRESDRNAALVRQLRVLSDRLQTLYESEDRLMSEKMGLQKDLAFVSRQAFLNRRNPIIRFFWRDFL